MGKRHGWLIGLVVVALLVVGCGPEMATPTPDSGPAEVDTGTSPTAGAETSESPPAEAGELPVNPDDWRVLGSPDAPLVIVEYSDFQWPYCAKYVRETFPQILETYVESGKVQYVFRNFPLYSIHPQAQKAAEAAECAGEQGQYWEMHDELFNSQEQWSGQPDAEATFKTLAGNLGLDQDQFDACLDGGTYADRVAADYQEGIAAEVSGTPAFRINGMALSGAQPFEAFEEQIEYFLAGGEAPTLIVGADSYRSLGEPDAPVVVTEFSDFQWPACGQVAREVIPELIDQYVDTGKVRFVFREYPLTQIHPAAQPASEAAVCAGQQGAYWEMNEKLFETVDEWGAGGDPTGYFKSYAEELGLDTKAFDQCLDSGEAAVVVQSDLMAGQALGVNATPYFFVNDIPLRGGLPIEGLGQIIDYAAAGGKMPEIVPRGDDWRVIGNTQTAGAISVAFADFANADSADHALEVMPQLQEQYIDSGKLVYILHPVAGGMDSAGAKAAIAAECAGEQGQYWEIYEVLFEEQAAWSGSGDPQALFVDYAEALDLESGAFQECLDSEWAALRVQAGNVLASLYGVPGAQVFLFSNGEGAEGSPAFEEFQTIIESILNP